MKKENFATGRLGEAMAREYLIKNGYQIVESNFKTKFGEIDIICLKNNILVFVEVKLKIGDKFGTPEEMIGKRKILQIQNTSIAYLQKNSKISNSYSNYRIDAICIVTDRNFIPIRTSHYENVGQ